MHSDELPVKQYAYLCWPPTMKINYQYADQLNEEQKHTKHKHTNNTKMQRKDDRQTPAQKILLEFTQQRKFYNI